MKAAFISDYLILLRYQNVTNWTRKERMVKPTLH